MKIDDQIGDGGETYLEELQANKTSYQSGGRRDGRNDLSCNLLSGVSVCRVDVVVHCAEVGRCGDEVDVEVGIVILLEFHWVQSVTNQRRRRRQLLHQFRKVADIWGKGLTVAPFRLR